MNYICTWLCVDDKGEESIFPQTGSLSSSFEHQAIYWRCVLLFFVSSTRFNKSQKHILFTNSKELPLLDNVSVSKMLEAMNVEVIITDFKYKTPRGYYGSFQNQFYEFSIIENISNGNYCGDDLFLILDSDCVFIKPVDKMFKDAKETGFMTIEDYFDSDYVINGLSRNDMKVIYEELLEKKLTTLPSYFLGELLLCSVTNLKKIHSDFIELWPKLIKRHKDGLLKFNEEAHTLSFLYHVNGLSLPRANNYLRRIWTNPVFFRNTNDSDLDLTVWHVPAEKTFGLRRLYDTIIENKKSLHVDLSDQQFVRLLSRELNVPKLRYRDLIRYYFIVYYRAIRKRLN